MPPSAAPEWLRVGWSLETIATSAPASCASIAARMPAQPAPITSTSCFASTAKDATESAAHRRAGPVLGEGPPSPNTPVPLLGLCADRVRRRAVRIRREVRHRDEPPGAESDRPRLDHDDAAAGVPDRAAATDGDLRRRAAGGRRDLEVVSCDRNRRSGDDLLAGQSTLGAGRSFDET